MQLFSSGPRLLGLCLALLAGPGLLAGCSPKRIPGLGISVDDTPDNRAIVQVLKDYAEAFEAKDLERLVGLASESYFETAGTPDPVDDYNRDGLRAKMTEYFKTIDKPTVSLTLKSLKVEEQRATVDYQYVCRYLMKLPSGERWQVTDELARMELEKVGQDWKITRGM
ncbi:MAG TPA: hypothetical protein PK668_04525 [Myxococcota bacterium]|nr:hypothetical protein [Myxococcota bacterium]HRY92125.1 hypothetical protein [Myxococcota bacterium]HSA21734.1 hypothetical protein [Myxococcota bacterium]